MKLERAILIYDTETTGVDPTKDRIIEIGVSVIHPDGTIKPRGWSMRFNPGIPISTEATEVHKITDEMVKDCPPFSAYAAKLHSSFQGKDIATYNGRRLDLPLLDEEFRRCGLKLDLTGVRVIDCQAIFFKRDPRDLAAAVERYCGRKHEGAHGAGVDAEATADVLMGQLAAYPDLDSMSLDQLAEYARLGDFEPVDLAGKLYRDADGFVCFSFGKNKGKRLVDQRGYCGWVMGVDFPGSTKEAIMRELERA